MPGCLPRKGSRVFALLGKATPLGLAGFSREDASRSWALTAELGCLRLERLSGDEELTGQQLFLPLPSDYDYGLTGPALRRNDGVAERWSAGNPNSPLLHHSITPLWASAAAG